MIPNDQTVRGLLCEEVTQRCKYAVSAGTLHEVSLTFPGEWLEYNAAHVQNGATAQRTHKLEGLTRVKGEVISQ